MKNTYYYPLAFMCLLLAGCKPHKIDFTVSTDANKPGRLILVNQSANSTNFFWQWRQIDNGGTAGYSPEDVSDEENLEIYPIANGEIEISLTASGKLSPDEEKVTKRFAVTNVPARATITQVIIKRLTLTRPNGTDYDDNDGTQPDVAFISCSEFCAPGANISPEPGSVRNNMAGITFPYTYTLTEPEQFGSFTPQTSDFEFAIVDYDNESFGIYETMARFSFSIYETTPYFDEKKDCYPTEVLISKPNVEAIVKIKWE